MHKKVSKRTLLVRRIVVYTLMVSVTTSLVTIMVLVMLGYRFNKDSNTIQQGGLVQFISKPSGANITIGHAKLANKTPTKITVNPGQYRVTMQRDGYKPWQKMVEVGAGKLLWLNYAQLVPTTITTTPVKKLDDVAQAVTSPSGRLVAYTTNTALYELALLNVRSGDFNVQKVATGLVPNKGYQNGVTLREWSGDDQRLLATRTMPRGTEWLYIDSDVSQPAVNLSATYGIAIKSASFDPRSADKVIILAENGELYTVNTGSRTLPAAAARGVLSYSVVNRQHILYRYKDTAGEQKIGYVSLDKTEGRELPVDAKTVQYVSATSYFNIYYIAVARNDELSIYRMNDMPSSTVGSSALAATLVTSQKIRSVPTGLSWQTGGRMAVVEHADGYDAYDNELGTFSTTKYVNASKVTLRWLDEYHVYYYSKSGLEVAEFDGGNPYTIKEAAGLTAALSNDGTYLYSIAKTGSTYSLLQSRMILP
ncbi:PEGA domain-containing protein [Candidatus Saccharibacteria bacterium]|nr:PEGA domain-containing protein [Candidatus Saccharibacteria bacterium]